MKTRCMKLNFSADPDLVRRPRSPRSAPIWQLGRIVLLSAILLGLSSLCAMAGQAPLPSGVPNIFDSKVRDHFELVGVTNLRGNPDFPVLLLHNTAAKEKPEAVLLGMDARNGEETWSLESDPIILIVVFTDPETMQGLYVDTGFADQGKASGSYAIVDDQNSPMLPDLLKAVTEIPIRTFI